MSLKLTTFQMAKESQGKNGCVGHHQAPIRLFTIKLQPSPEEPNPCVLPLTGLRCVCSYSSAPAESKVSAVHCLSGPNGLFELLNDPR